MKRSILRRAILFAKIPLIILITDALISTLLIISVIFWQTFGAFMFIGVIGSISIIIFLIIIAATVQVIKKIYNDDLRANRFAFIH